MTSPRRRLVRPSSNGLPQQNQRRREQLRARLERELIALARWQSRLRRAFNTVDRMQKTVARIEKQLTRLEEP